MPAEKTVENPLSQKARNERIDALKCFAIGMVVLTHVLNLRPEFKFLAPWLVDAMLAFNMPLFALLSGYVYFGREGKGVRFIAGKALSLLVPYLAWIAVVMPQRHLPPQAWLPRLAQALVDPHAGFQMWFLWTLFWVFVAITVARSTPWPDAVSIVLALACGILWLGQPSKMYGFDKVTWLYFFFVIGYYVAKYRDRLRRFEPAIFLAGGVAIVFIVAVGLVRQYPLFAGIAGVAASCGLYSILPSATIGPQAWAGRRSLGIYGSQMVVLPYCIFGSGWLWAAISWSLAFAGSLLLTLALEITPLTKAVFTGVWPKPWVNKLTAWIRV